MLKLVVSLLIPQSTHVRMFSRCFWLLLGSSIVSGSLRIVHILHLLLQTILHTEAIEALVPGSQFTHTFGILSVSLRH